MEDQIFSMQRRIDAIEQRNARVERDKAWETSFTRIFVISVLTYFVAVLAFWMLGNQRFFLNALIPTVAFIVSVQSVPMVKKWWMSRW